MIISQVNLENEQEILLLPPGVRGLLKKGGTIVFAAIEKGEYLAVAVVTIAQAGIAKHCIRYLRAYDDSDIELMGSLLKEIENTCRANGENMLAVRIIDDFSNHREANYILIKNDYTPIQLNGKFLIYNFKDIALTEFVKKVENLEAVKKYVKFLRQVEKRQLVELWEKLKKSDENLKYEKPDLIFGRFFIMDDEIKGYMDMREVYPGMLMLYDVYAEKSKKAKNAFPMMLASVIQLTQAMMPEDTVIILPLYAEHLYNGFKTVFGKAAVEHGIYEYVKTIADEEPASPTDKQDEEDDRIRSEIEEKLEVYSAIAGTDIMSPAMLKGQRDIMPV